MYNRKKIAILSILLPAMLIISNITANAAKPFRDLIAQAAILAEADTGEILYQHNINVRRPADALTRVMTMILVISAIENGDTDNEEIIEMTESALSDIVDKSSTMGISPGDKMPLIDLMHCAFIAGAQEACNLLAEHIAGSVDEFVTMMNERAEELGCDKTHFTNPSGLYNADQYTTALDQYKIYREAMSYSLFEEVSGKYRYTLESDEDSESRRITGANPLLNSNSSNKYYYRQCRSGISSITYEGGHSFAGLAESDELSLIVVVLGSDAVIFEDKSAEMRNLTEARRLFEWGFDEFEWRTILSSTELVRKVPVVHGAGADFVIVRAEKEIRLIVDKGIPPEEFIRTITIYSEKLGEPLIAPIEAGTVLGEVTVTRRGEDYGTRKLIATTGIDLHRLEFMMIQLREMLSSSIARTVIIVLILLVAAYAALVIRYNIMRVRRLRKIKEAKKRLIEEHNDVSSKP